VANTSHGPRSGEAPTQHRGRVDRVGVLSDVHGNVPALEAVLAEVDGYDVDVLVFCGDLSWGAEPGRTVNIVRRLGPRAVFVRGNADRAVVELARGLGAQERPREEWMLAQHSAASVQLLADFPHSAVVDVTWPGPVRFCHGSPRSDTELVTPGTPVERLAELARLIPEKTLVTGHTHLQFDRTAAGLRSINAGSVGLPYHDGPPGIAYWATFGPDVHLRQTNYDVNESLRRSVASGDPGTDAITELLSFPPTVAEVIEHAAGLVFSD